jgi:FkbM family methyltransferase
MAQLVRQGARDRLLSAYARRGWRGFDRLLTLAGHRRGDRIRARTRYGGWFDLDPWSWLERIALREGYYESEVLEALVAGLSPGDVIWDVGANIGLHAVSARLAAPHARVVAFEPSPSTLGLLWRHAALNGGGVDVLSLALSDRPGLATLHIATAGNTGMTTLSPQPGGEYAARAIVATSRGDDLVSAGQVPAPTVVKLDVEGHEARVLDGMAATLASAACRRVVFEDAPGEATPVKDRLRAAGFAVAPLGRREHSAAAVENFVASKP